MPDYPFFFSYASNDRNVVDRESEVTNKQDFLKIFFNDLDREMKELGYPDGGFFDKESIESQWKRELAQGLASSRILVPLYSPNYFQSAYCGKEWETFRLRFEENEVRRYPDVTNSKVILPVLWKAPVVFPEGVSQSQIQYEKGLPAEYKDNGLWYLLNFKRKTIVYKQFIHVFARQLLELADAQGAPKVRDLLEIDTLNPPFPGLSRPGLKYVRYVFVAGLKMQMEGLRTVNNSYANFRDRRDWRPCFPDQDLPVGGIATGPAKADQRGFEFLAPTPHLMDHLREARRLNNVILVVVDPWSVKLPDFHQFLQDFDAEGFPNSAVLVNWNGKDPETMARKQQLQLDLLDYFRGRVGRQEYHKGEVSSVGTFEQAVVEAFNAVQARLIALGKICPAGDGEAGKAAVIRNSTRNV
jgi:FxsC-like protein